jgi:predicted PurR-regulated permease PerM
MNKEPNRPYRDKPYFKWGTTALVVIIISILLVVIFTDIPGFFSVLKGFGAILSPLVAGVVFAFLLNPLVKFVDTRLCPVLEKKKQKNPKARYSPQKLSRAAGIVFALVIAVLLVYAFFSMLLPQLYESVMGIVASAEDYYRSIETWANKLLQDNPEIQSYVEAALDEVYNFLRNWVSTSLLSDMQKLLSTLTTSVIAVVKSVANLLIGLVASIYMLWSKDLFQAQAKKLIVAVFRPSAADHLFYLGRETNKIFNGFVIGKIIDSAIIGILCYFGMLILKLPYPILVATVIGITNVIPFFGPIIGAVPCAFLILLVNPLQCFYFVIFVICLQQLDGNVIGPKILGNTIGISGFWVLVSITVAAGLFGFAGMLLGVPVFACIHSAVSFLCESSLRKKGVTDDTIFAPRRVLTGTTTTPKGENHE